MKVDVTFVNFPVSESTRQLVADKIEEHVSKFSTRVIQARAVFSVEGPTHIVRLHVTGGGVNTHVSATANDVSRCVDQVIDKLDATLRKLHARKKDRRHDLSTGEKLGRIENAIEVANQDEGVDEELFDFDLDEAAAAARAIGT